MSAHYAIPSARMLWRMALIACLVLLVGCSLPALEGRSVSSALTAEESGTTVLGRALAEQVAENPGLSGIYPLADAHDAFAARMLLAQAAERTLDVQYYIWRRDTTGLLLLDKLYDAAERGVRVRLLLDDHGAWGLDEELAALNLHPDIEVRLFNPFALRSHRWFGFMTDFWRLNRRMHNKTFIADNQAAIIGGRNIGDEYFGATDGLLFADLDVLSIGSVVPDTSDDFDRYWSSASAFPIDSLVAPVAENLERFVSRAAELESGMSAAEYLEAVRDAEFMRSLFSGELKFEWARTHLVSDDPRKVLDKADVAGLMLPQVFELIDVPTKSINLVSPYFVPTKAGTNAFVALAQEGVRVRVLTNALEATDVVAVHSGYAKWRRELIEGGVELYELRRLPNGGPEYKAGPFGSSGSSLHAKTFAVDGRKVFVGSFNFDPRSARLNTELGFVIESPRLAAQITEAFDEGIPISAYSVGLDDNGRLYWLENGTEGEVVRHEVEPGASMGLRFGVWLMSLLPIDWML